MPECLLDKTRATQELVEVGQEMMAASQDEMKDNQRKFKTKMDTRMKAMRSASQRNESHDSVHSVWTGKDHQQLSQASSNYMSLILTSLSWFHCFNVMMRALTPISNVRGHLKPILFISFKSFAMDLAAYQFVVSNAGNRNFSGVWIFFSISYILKKKKDNRIVIIETQDTCVKCSRFLF